MKVKMAAGELKYMQHDNMTNVGYHRSILVFSEFPLLRNNDPSVHISWKDIHSGIIYNIHTHMHTHAHTHTHTHTHTHNAQGHGYIHYPWTIEGVWSEAYPAEQCELRLWLGLGKRICS